MDEESQCDIALGLLEIAQPVAVNGDSIWPVCRIKVIHRVHKIIYRLQLR